MSERPSHFHRPRNVDMARKDESKGRGCSSLYLSLAALTLFMGRKTFLSLDQAHLPLTTTPTPTAGVSSSFTIRTVNKTQLALVKHRNPTLSSLPSKQSKKFPPLSCWQLFLENRDRKRSIDDPNDGCIHGRYTRTEPPFWVSLHRREFDKTRWTIMNFGVYYETTETQSFVDILRADAKELKKVHAAKAAENPSQTPISPQPPPPPPLHVVDVGGNIGWYSLMSIATAREQQYPIVVDVFEPNPRNQPRLCESLFINEWLPHEQVALNLYPVGVTSSAIATDETAVGRMDITKAGRGSLKAMKTGSGVNQSLTASFPLVSLDQMATELGWMRPGHVVSILKVDVEGFERDVFLGAEKLLRSKVVQNVFFEGNVQNEFLQKDFLRVANILVSSGYAAYKVGAFRGADIPVKATFDPSTTKHRSRTFNLYLNKLVKECKGEMKNGRILRNQCNMWWRLHSPTKLSSISA